MKKKLAIGCAVVAVLAIAVIIGVCLSIGHEVSKTHDVRYEVTGSAQSVDLTYTNDTGGTSQQSAVPLPWSYSFKGDTLAFVDVSAQNTGETGTVIATIYRDGEMWKTSTSEGAYVIASASGAL